MKYKAVQLEEGSLHPGKWATGCGRSKYFINSVCETEEEAKQQAIVRSIQYHYDESQKLFGVLVEKYPDKYSDMDEHDKCNFGDINC